MGSPYRSTPETQSVQRPRDSGIVGEIIDQFADHLAFYRELIQNAIDATTEAIDVDIRYDQALQALSVAVTDRGEGMSREVIEERLLVLFPQPRKRTTTRSASSAWALCPYSP